VAWLTGYAAAVRISLAILVTLVGCKNHDVEQLDAVKAEVCACKTTSCADDAMNRIAKASIPSTLRTQATAREILECRAKLEAAERPTTDPDAEGSAAAAGSAEPAALPSAAGKP
jgi:hypothetical protein